MEAGDIAALPEDMENVAGIYNIIGEADDGTVCGYFGQASARGDRIGDSAMYGGRKGLYTRMQNHLQAKDMGLTRLTEVAKRANRNVPTVYKVSFSLGMMFKCRYEQQLISSSQQMPKV